MKITEEKDELNLITLAQQYSDDDKPHTCNSHLTLKQVEKLQVELARLKNFHLADRKTERELRCYYGRMRQLVRAALKFHKPIAM
jgi:hypothetical protein